MGKGGTHSILEWSTEDISILTMHHCIMHYMQICFVIKLILKMNFEKRNAVIFDRLHLIIILKLELNNRY